MKNTVDAHVGKALFNNAILGSLKAQGKTVILVTHALHFLSQVDFIYTVVNGSVTESGTFQELTERNGTFSKLISEFGGHDNEETPETDVGEPEGHVQPLENIEIAAKENPSTEKMGKLINAEKRSIGSVPMKGIGCFRVV